MVLVWNSRGSATLMSAIGMLQARSVASWLRSTAPSLMAVPPFVLATLALDAPKGQRRMTPKGGYSARRIAVAQVTLEHLTDVAAGKTVDQHHVRHPLGLADLAVGEGLDLVGRRGRAVLQRHEGHRSLAPGGRRRGDHA